MSSLLNLLKTRLAIARLEWLETKAKLRCIVILFVCAIISGLLCLLLLFSSLLVYLQTFFAAQWIYLGLGLLFLTASVVCIAWMTRLAHIKTWFCVTCAELEKDWRYLCTKKDR